MREELAPEIRFSIAIQAYFAQSNKKYETITALAKEYEIYSKSQPILIDEEQEFLNLFAFYHNHRVYNEGK